MFLAGSVDFPLALGSPVSKSSALSDHEQAALETYATNFPDVVTHCGNLFRTTGEEIRRAFHLEHRQIDLLAGGPPCQGFSAGGVRTKKDSRNRGIMAFARLVVEVRPRYFLMENVRGFLFSDQQLLRDRFCRTLAKAGYVVGPFKLLNAADFEVPQRRVRAFVMGCQKSEIFPEYPISCPTSRPTVRDAIGDLTVVDRKTNEAGTDVFPGRLGKASPYSAKMRARPGCDRPLTGCLRASHSKAVVERFMATPPGTQEPVSRYYRLAWDGVSPTLRAGTGPDHGSHTASRPIHPESPRCITVREAARLQSFPDWFVFHETKWHGFRQIGNSVPPLLAQAFGLSLLKALNGQ